MKQKIFWSLFTICFVLVLLGLVASVLFFTNHYDRQMALHLKQSSHYIATGLKQYGIDYLLKVNTTYRISLIDSLGNVIYDNAIDPNLLDNQAKREEFQESMEYGVGQSYRYSSNTSEQMLYYAVKIMLSKNLFSNAKQETGHFANLNTISSVSGEQPYILSIASQHKNTYMLLYDFSPYICIGFIVCLAMSYALANSIATSIIAPLNTLRLDNPLAFQSYKELSPLLHKIDEQNRLIQAQIKQLQAKQEEFSAITQNMADGFLLLDSKGNILSFNKSSTRLFGALYEGMNIEMLHRQYTIWFKMALAGQRHTQTIEHNDCNYQIIIESVFEPLESLDTQDYQSGNEKLESNYDLGRLQDLIDLKQKSENLESKALLHNTKPIGVAIIILDITEKAQREQLRREFSSNVSHELKTPLTSILGVTEMLQNNLIKQADIPKFLDNIHKEAKHLMCLIEDIIILNELDCDYTFMPCPLSMQDLCHIAINMLSDSIKQKQIQCDIKGSDFIVMGEQRLLIALIFNLCENAIKYNRNHGSITILLHSDKKSLCIKDNGIGIPTMYHERIFERFFCVDKSHSNMINGTGLGLSIVKHIAILHNATIKLESELEIGTSIMISFPLESHA